MRHLFKLFLFFPLALTVISCGESQEKPSNEEEEIVREQAQKYINAINQKDLETIVEFWSPEAVYKNPITGNLVKGREEIKAEIAKVFEQLGDAKVEFKIDSIEFPVEGKATERGVTILTIPGKDPFYSDYKMIHVKENGKWLILHVSQLDFGMLNQQEN